MREFSSVAELRAALAPLRGRQRVSLVPTMGNLHEGRLSTMREAQRRSECVIAYIFVNRLQFGPSEDFDSYPRTLDDDRKKLLALDIPILFAPTEREVYPEPQEFLVQPPPIADDLCGAFRPGHFRGMATVVLKMFNIVQPDLAVFGKKDFQQWFIIRRMVRQLNLPIDIVGGETVREPDGLAMSSRNVYLSAEERREAVQLNSTLRDIGQRLHAGETDHQALAAAAQRTLDARGWRCDYITIRCRSDLQHAADERELVVVAAAWLGSTRLIDNLEVTLPA